MAFRRGDRLASGRRDRTVKIQQLTESIDVDSGEPVETWATLVKCMPAARIDLSGTERMVANQIAAKYDVEWEINYRDDMDPEQIDVPKTRRLIVHDRVHDIVTAVMVGRKAGVRLQTLASSMVPS